MLFNFLLVLHVIVCLALIAIVLIQRGRGAGLVESMSGAESIFGTKTSDYLVKATTTLAVLYFVFSLSLAALSKQRGKSITAKMAVPSVVTEEEKKDVAVEAKVTEAVEEVKAVEAAEEQTAESSVSMETGAAPEEATE